MPYQEVEDNFAAIHPNYPVLNKTLSDLKLHKKILIHLIESVVNIKDGQSLSAYNV